MQNILIVAAHPDDELLGCGGTVARHIDDGDKVFFLIMAEGATARDNNRNSGTHIKAEKLFDSCRKVSKYLGAEEPVFGKLFDNRMDSYDFLDIVKIIENFSSKIQPSVVYTHHGNDLNIDHQITHRAVLTALRPVPENKVESVFAFETLSSSEWSSKQQGASFVPQHYVEITKYLEKKINALKIYEEEIKEFPHPRSIAGVKALAQYRGSTVGVHAAEAYEIIYNIKKLK